MPPKMVSGQFGSGDMPYEYDGLGSLPHLSEMTATAIEILDNDANGFFIMVEGGRIDHACHSNNIRRAVHEAIEFSNAVQVAVDWVNATGQTDYLILVTADHETGGLTVVANNGAGNYPDVTWSTTGHTERDVPVFARGVNSELISAVMDNTEMFEVVTADTSSTTLPTGASFSDRTFNWTPGHDQAGTYQVTFAADDGEAKDSETITITVNDANGGVPSDELYTDNFNAGDCAGWKTVDNGGSFGPSTWSAAGAVIAQGSNIFSGGVTIDMPGTYAFYEDGIPWTDYRLALTMKSNDDDGIGVMFRYQDNNNYYRFSWDRQRIYRRLVKKTDGVFTLLAEDHVPYVTGQTYQVEIVACGPAMQVFVDGQLVLWASDVGLESGTIALYAWGNAGSYFDDVVVEGSESLP